MADKTLSLEQLKRAVAGRGLVDDGAVSGDLLPRDEADAGALMARAVAGQQVDMQRIGAIFEREQQESRRMGAVFERQQQAMQRINDSLRPLRTLALRLQAAPAAFDSLARMGEVLRPLQLGSAFPAFQVAVALPEAHLVKAGLAQIGEVMESARRWAEEWQPVTEVMSPLAPDDREAVWAHLGDQDAGFVLGKIRAFISYGGVEYARETLLNDAHYHCVRLLEAQEAAVNDHAKRRASAAGKASGAARSEAVAEKHSQVVAAWKQLLASGKQERNTTAILAERFGLTPTQVRTIKKKAKAN